MVLSPVPRNQTELTHAKSLPCAIRLDNKPARLTIACLLLALGSHAATITWTGASSSAWTNSANWSPPQVPTNGDTVVINTGTIAFDNSSVFSNLTFTAGTISGPVVVGSNAVLNWNGG